jgi:NAD(P)-dependent dehydrogenase (short-subunit alcohol dehydrogenase family)
VPNPGSRPSDPSASFLETRANLAGKVAVVTGGAGGLGRAVTLDLARAGVDVALVDRDEAAVARTVADVDALGRAVVARVADVRAPEALDAFFADFDRAFDRLDVLVNVVGGTFKADFVDTNPKGWDTLVRTNFTQVLHATHQALARMRAAGRGGSIINLTSIEGYRAAPGYAVYSAMKAGVAQLARTLAVELAPERIRINNIAPDMVPTEGMMGISAIGADALSESLNALGDRVAIPMGRKGTLEDVGNCALFLASDLSAYVTGTTLHPDGGAWASAGWFNWPGDGFRNTAPRTVLEHLLDS